MNIWSTVRGKDKHPPKEKGTVTPNGNDHRSSVRDAMEKEVVKMLAEEIRNASRDLVDEQRRLIRQVVEEHKRVIGEVVEEEKLAIRASVEETREAIITSLGMIFLVARQEADRPQLGQESRITGETSTSIKGVLSPEALELVAKIDEGGIPLTITRNLERIASEHGIQVSGDMTPNDLVSRLRNLADRSRDQK